MESKRRCLVLGGSGRVGSEVCSLLAERGAQVAFTYFSNETKARELESQLPGCRAIQLDLRNFQGTFKAVEEVAEKWDGLDVLIQCAGIAGDGSLYKTNGSKGNEKLLKITESGWDDMMDITAKGTFAACQAAARAMQNGGGHIIIVGSMEGVKTVPTPVHYAASKGALKTMVQALAKELGKSGIVVNMVAPGILEGGMSDVVSKELKDEYIKYSSLSRLGTFRETAEWVAWLAMENTYLSGQAVLLDGGL